MAAFTQPTDTKSSPRAALIHDDGHRTPTMLGALYALIAANAMQIAAGLATIEPSPPAAVLPFIAATAALGIAAVPMVRTGRRGGYLLGIAFCLVSMIGMGPHKLFLEDGLIIAPLALVGFTFELVFIRAAVGALRGRS
jgi:hypothetical protein